MTPPNAPSVDCPAYRSAFTPSMAIMLQLSCCARHVSPVAPCPRSRARLDASVTARLPNGFRHAAPVMLQLSCCTRDVDSATLGSTPCSRHECVCHVTPAMFRLSWCDRSVTPISCAWHDFCPGNPYQVYNRTRGNRGDRRTSPSSHWRPHPCTHVSATRN